MKARHIAQVVLTLLLLLLVSESGLALTTQPNGPSDGANTTADSVANAPWFNSEVDTSADTGKYVSITIDRNGIPWISYITNSSLMMAHYLGSDGNCGPGNAWQCFIVHFAGSGVINNSIERRYNEIAIAYNDPLFGNLKYARAHIINPMLLTHDEIDKAISPSRTGLHVSLQRHFGDTPFISYQFENPIGYDALKVAHSVVSGGNCGYGGAEGKWQCDTVHTGEGVGQYTSLAIDASENVHIAYYDASNGDLWYATNSSANNCGPGNTWTCYAVSTLNDVGRYASMYVDNANNFHIAYYDATADVLKYAYKVSGGGNCGVLGSAQCDTIDAMLRDDYHPVGISMAEDAAGYPVIAYQSEYGDLNVARPVAALGLPIEYGNCGPVSLLYHTWYCETIHRQPRFAVARHGDFVSIATNSAGLATIAYHEFITSSGGNLGVSQQRLQVFMPSVVKSP